MSLKHISVIAAKGLQQEGATLIDIREPNEFAAQSIPGSRNVPLSTLADAKLDVQGAKVIFLCKSGMRTAANEIVLSRLGGPGAQVMQGGLMAWASAGLPTESNAPARKGILGMFG
jgi:rhodanese-related sulfurtransferase